MKKHKYSLTKKQFIALRETLKVRQSPPFLDENIEAAHAVMVKNQPVRVVANSIGKSVSNMNRIVRQLWCIANGKSHWDLYLHNKRQRLANEKAKKSIPCPNPAAQSPGPDAITPRIRRLHAVRDADDHKRRKRGPLMRCVYRSVEERGRGLGWQVAIKRTIDGRTRRFVEFFADTEHGGEDLSLAAAKSWRDDIERDHRRLTCTDNGTQVPPGVYRALCPTIDTAI